MHKGLLEEKETKKGSVRSEPHGGQTPSVTSSICEVAATYQRCASQGRTFDVAPYRRKCCVGCEVLPETVRSANNTRMEKTKVTLPPPPPAERIEMVLKRRLTHAGRGRQRQCRNGNQI